MSAAQGERGPWRSSSPSQLSTFADCARKWWRVAVNGERPPSGPAAELGSKIHAELEAYLVQGGELSHATARAIAQHLPYAGRVSAGCVEVGFTWQPKGWPVPVRGFVDLVEVAGGVLQGITDHKTTSSLDYAKSVRDLARDPQALLYTGAAYAGALEGVGGVVDDEAPLRFRLVYGTTRAPYTSREVAAHFSRSGVEAGLERLGERAQAQAHTARAERWVDVEPSYSACDKFGGCPFLSDCRAQARPLPVYDEVSMSSADDWFKALGAPAPSAPALAPAPAPVPEPEPDLGPLPDFLRVPDEPEPAAVVEAATLEALGAVGAYDINPPDGLPDGVEPELEPSRSRVLRVDVGGELKAAGGCKVGELKEALALKVQALSPPLKAAYDERSAGLKLTKEGVIERLELCEALSSGAVLPSDEVPVSSEPVAFDLFTAGALVPSEPVSEPVASAPAPAPVASAPVSEPVPVASAPVSVPSAPAPVTSAPSLARVLLVDAHAVGAVEGEAVLAPLIAELGQAHGQPLALMDFARGWVLLGFEVERRGWAAVFQGASVVRFDSSSPVYRHASHALLAQASLVVRGSR